jgi:hypothetical protein
VLKDRRCERASVCADPPSRCFVDEELDGAAASGFAGAEVEKQIHL